MRRWLLRLLLVGATIVVLMAVWIGLDLNWSYKVDIRDFDPDEVARLDTAMWRSYYERERLRLFRELTELLGHQFHFPFWRRQLVAFHAAKGAFVFKDGHSRDGYLNAMPDVQRFYEQIRDVSITDFDAHRAAELEVEWWIVHRQRKMHQPGDLSRALAEAAAAVYRLPAENFTEHADLRAQAMEIRDSKAEAGGVTEGDWRHIDELLHRSWRSLHVAVNK
ncbi:MAG: hypothetical protein IPM59_03975 [Chloracidobacterium sp.]|nr:hypothetical protein [Chloracidobacterium sp.]